MVVPFAGQVLFSGDHLWWGREPHGLVASRRYCWWDWEEQKRSVLRLRDLDVRWLLPRWTSCWSGSAEPAITIPWRVKATPWPLA